MDPVKKYWLIMRILSTILLIIQGLYYTVTQAGPMDTFNAIVAGVTIYAIWFARERTVE